MTRGASDPIARRTPRAPHIRYSRFNYIEPPRTKIVAGSHILGEYEQRRWWAQIKRHGSNSVIFVSPSRQVTTWNRHSEQHEWQFNKETGALFRSLPGRRWWVFNGELLHAQMSHIKDTHYLFDVLVYDGDYLIGTTYQERYERLFSLWPHHGMDEAHFVLDRYTWLARNHVRNFADLFAGLTNREDEGLMLKRPDGLLAGSNANSWMTKVRR